MKIKIVAGVLSLLGMQYLSAADPKEDDIARRLVIHSNYYATALKWSKAANPAEYYNDFLKSTEKVEDIQFDGILEVLKNAEDESEQGLLNSYRLYKDKMKIGNEKRKAIIELLKSADYLDIQAHALISACVDDLSELYKQRFQADPNSIVQEADRLSVVQQRLMIKKMLKPHKHELSKFSSEKGVIRKELIEKELAGHSISPFCVVYSPNGLQVASASLNEVIVWDVESGTVVKKYEGFISNLSNISYDPNGSKLAWIVGDHPVVLNLETGQKHEFTRGYADAMAGSYLMRDMGSSLTYNPKGSHLATGEFGGSITIWGVESGQPLNRFGGHSSYVHCLNYNSNGLQLVSGSGDQNVIIWDVKDINHPTQLLKIAAGKGDLRILAFSEDSLQLFSKFQDGELVVWNAKSGDQIKKSNKNPFLLPSKNVSPDGSRLAISCKSGMVVIIISPKFKEIVDSVSVAQALYICYRLAELQKPSLEEASSQEIKEDERVEPFYEILANRAAVALMISFFGINQAGEAVASWSEQKKPLLNRIRDSLPPEIKELLDKKS